MRTLALPKEVEHWSLTTLREKLVKIGAKVVRHGRYVRFQLAEVAVPRNLFREFLRQIDGLRPRHQHDAEREPGIMSVDGRSASGWRKIWTKWACEHGQISKFCLSDDCGGDTIPMMVNLEGVELGLKVIW